MQHKQMFIPNQQMQSPNMGMLEGGGQFAAAPGGFLGSKRANAMQQAVSRYSRHMCLQAWSSLSVNASCLNLY